MIDVSNGWKNQLGCYQSPYRVPFLKKSTMSIEYLVGDNPYIQTHATVLVSPEHSASRREEAAANLMNNNFTELGWTCREAPPDSYEDARGLYYYAWEDGDEPEIEITLPYVTTEPIGTFDVYWNVTGGVYPEEYYIYYKNASGTVIQTEHITDNDSSINTIDTGNLTGYKKITFMPKKLNLRTEQEMLGLMFSMIGFRFGAYDTLTNANVTSIEWNNTCDFLSFTLPDNYIKVTVDNSDKQWDPDNTEGFYNKLTQGKKVRLRITNKINNVDETIQVGSYFITEWNIPQNGITADFTARSLLSFMQQNFSITPGTYTLYRIAQMAFQQCNLPTDDEGGALYSISNSLQNISITVTADDKLGDYSCAQILQLVANAGCMVIKISPYGVVSIEPMELDNLSDYFIDRYVSYKNAEYTITKDLATVNVNNGLGTYTYGNNGVNQEVKNPLIKTAIHAGTVAAWVASILSYTKSLQGEFRADPRLEVCDMIKNENQYSSHTFYIQSINYKYTGSIRGTYVGNVVVTIPNKSLHGEYYSGTTKSNEFWETN